MLPRFLDDDRWPANSLDLNYCIRDEFAQAINWNKVTSKISLIAEFKRSVKKIRLYVVRESCSLWMNRLYRMTQNDGNYWVGKKFFAFFFLILFFFFLIQEHNYQ